jgi:CDP-diacylglycerol---glycerol-3-phosphate 3-phosphatidyltransferase
MRSFKEIFKEPAYRVLNAPTRLLVRWRVHPNAISLFGFFVTVGAGWMYHQDHVRWAGLFVILGGIIDIFDGRVARETGLASKFGSFFDSTLDRLSEIAVFLGLLSLYNQYGREMADVWMVYVIMIAMGGSLMVSYTRARAEALGLDCNTGIMQRAERVVLLGGGSLIFGLMWDGLVLKWVIIILAVSTVLTTIQRIWWVYKHGAGVPLRGGSPPVDESITREEAL